MDKYHQPLDDIYIPGHFRKRDSIDDLPRRFPRQDSEAPTQKLVYICHPLSDDIPGNIAAVTLICGAIMQQEVGKRQKPPQTGGSWRKVVPIAAHLLFPTFMDDEDQDERALILDWCLAMVERVDEVWVFGPDMSAGMRMEIELASKLGIPVLFKDPKTFGKVRRDQLQDGG